MKEIISKNKVFIVAIIGALVLVGQQALTSGDISWKSMGYAALIGILGVIANQWPRKGITILGIIGTIAGVVHNNLTTGTFTWNELILSSIIAVLTALLGQLSAGEELPADEPPADVTKSARL